MCVRSVSMVRGNSLITSRHWHVHWHSEIHPIESTLDCEDCQLIVKFGKVG